MNRNDYIALAQSEVSPVFFSIQNDTVDVLESILRLERAIKHLKSAKAADGENQET